MTITNTRIQRVVDTWREDYDIPAALVSVRMAGDSIANVASGQTDLSTHRAAQPTDRSWAGSITKTATAAAMLRLVERGDVSLRDKVSKWFPQIPEADHITVRQLLNQTSGIPEWTTSPEFSAALADPKSPQWNEAHVIDVIAKQQRQRQPGSTFEYSNSNYIVAGAIIERVTEKPLIDVFTDELLRPNGISTSSARIDDGSGDDPTTVTEYSNFHTGLGLTNQQPAYDKGSVYRSVLGAAGGLVTTAPALARLGEAILWKRGSAISVHSRELMTGAADSSIAGYGFGIVRGEIETQHALIAKNYWHNGAVFGASSYLAHFPQQEETVAVLTNTDVKDDAYADLLARLLDATNTPPLLRADQSSM